MKSILKNIIVKLAYRYGFEIKRRSILKLGLSPCIFEEINLRPSEYPPEFDMAVYGKIHLELSGKSKPKLQQHYASFGRAEGWRANELENRQDFANLISQDIRSLEIGPFVNPLLSGKYVDYADYLSTEELIVRAQQIGLDPSNIPPIKYILKDISLGNITEQYDAVLTSHCIEHQPDLIEHLIQVQRLVEKNRGRYFVLVPDKRFCFDRHIADSTIADVIDAHENKRTLHPLKSIIEHRALTTHNDSISHWLDGGVQTPQKISLERVQSAIEEWRLANGQYIDVHAWYFTPESFVEIIILLNRLGYISFTVERLYPSRLNSNEFWAILKAH